MKLDFTQLAALAALAITALQMWKNGANPFSPVPTPGPTPAPAPTPTPVPHMDLLSQLKALLERLLAQNQPVSPMPPAQAAPLAGEAYHVPIRFTVTPTVVPAEVAAKV